MAYQQLTLTDLRARLNSRIESVPFWTTPELDDAINEALQFWGLLTSRWKRRATIETSANTYDFALPAALTYGMRVTFNGLPLAVTTRKELDWGRPNWRQESSVTGGDVPTRPTLWAPVSLAYIYIWPMDAYGHNSLLCDSVDATPELLVAGQYVDLGEEDVTLLLDYALHALAFKRDDVTFQSTMDLFRALLAAAGQENSLITTSQVYRQLMGLDRRDLKPFREAPSSLREQLSALLSADQDGGAQ